MTFNASALDRIGNIWLGCKHGFGFVSRIGTAFKSYVFDPITKIKLNHVFAVSPIGNGNILVGLQNGIVEIDRKNGRYIIYDREHLYHHIFNDKKGFIHVSTPDGLFIYDRGFIVPISKVYP